MASRYTKAEFDKLKRQIVEQIIVYGSENDSCKEGMIEFIQSAFNIDYKEAETLFLEVKKDSYETVTVSFTFSYDPDQIAIPAELYNASSYDKKKTIAHMLTGLPHCYNTYDDFVEAIEEVTLST